MTSIPHLEDLTAQEIIDVMDLEWTVTEKIDGTFMEMGLDDQGFYCRRKGGQPVRDPVDWPSECWANSYRSGHMAGEILIDTLLRNDMIKVGEKLVVEIVDGRRPNSVVYDFDGYTGYLIINSRLGTPGFNACIKFNSQRLISHDGREISTVDQTESWMVLQTSVHSPLLSKARLGQQARHTRETLRNLLYRPSMVEGLSNMEILEVSLSRRHPSCPPGQWSEFRKRIQRERSILGRLVREITLNFKDVAFRALAADQPGVLKVLGLKEGVVVNTPQLVFKIVDRERFSALNLFTHRIKYMVVGGRRPARSSFLSRTRDWPVERRLERLDVLLRRFVDNADRLIMRNSSGVIDHNHQYSGDLYQRTLNMFADTRKRIQHGR
jgi:hypothetical protein